MRLIASATRNVGNTVENSAITRRQDLIDAGAPSARGAGSAGTERLRPRDVSIAQEMKQAAEARDDRSRADQVKRVTERRREHQRGAEPEPWMSPTKRGRARPRAECRRRKEQAPTTFYRLCAA